MPTITINDRTIETSEQQTVLEAADSVGITIPTLCHHKDLSPVGSCRLCMVEIGGQPGQVAACTLPVSDGMVVQTETPTLCESRKFVLEMLLRNYHDAGYETHGAESEFTRWLKHYDVQLPVDSKPAPRYEIDSDPNPFVWVDLNKCIMCTRCVRACDEVQCRDVWGVGYRGHDAKSSRVLTRRCLTPAANRVGRVPLIVPPVRLTIECPLELVRKTNW